MMLSQPLTPVDEGAEPEPLVLSVGALRCRVANAKHLYTRIDECIRGTTYSQNRPSTFHNEERDILFQVGCAASFSQLKLTPCCALHAAPRALHALSGFKRSGKTWSRSTTRSSAS